MTRKDYIKAAAIIRESARPNAQPAIYRAGISEARSYFAHALADWFESDSPNFDRARFLAACGIEQE